MQPGQAEEEADPAEWAEGRLQPTAQPARHAEQPLAAEDAEMEVDRLSDSASEAEQEAAANSSTRHETDGSAERENMQVDGAQSQHDSCEASAGQAQSAGWLLLHQSFNLNQLYAICFVSFCTDSLCNAQEDQLKAEICRDTCS